MVMLFVGIGGMVGAILRYGLSLLIGHEPGGFPVATFVSNLAGSFILGGLTSFLFNKRLLKPYLANGLGTGLIGSFTTFSTFSFETVTLMTQGHLTLAFTYVFLSVFGGLIFVFAGYRFGEWL